MHTFLFDIDGTLIHSGGAGRDALEVALQTAFNRRGADCVELSGCTDRGIASQLFAYHAIEPTEENWERFRRAYLEALPERLAARIGRVLPGVDALLDQLAARDDVAVGLLTGNIREGARLKLAHYRLDHHFRFGGFGDQHPNRDDVAREAWAAACRHLGCEPKSSKLWVIGDTPHDVRCGRAIGARVVAVATGTFTRDELAQHRPDVLVEDLSQWRPEFLE